MDSTAGEDPPSAPLPDDPVDVAVVGAGIVGLTTALRLADQGMSVALLERDRVAGGTTGHTTAKVTALHGAAYHNLLDHGADVARTYAAANQWAVGEMARLADDIDCDWEPAPAYTYTTDPTQVDVIEREVAAAKEAGLPVTHESGDIGLPFAVLAAVKLTDQAMFHPRRYGLGLARLLGARGVTVTTDCQVLDIHSDGQVETSQGIVRAGAVVLATHLPFVNRGGHFATTQPNTSYAVVATIEGEPPAGMYLGIGEDGRSVRPLAADSIIVGGDGHVTGRDPDSLRRFDGLENWARGVFPVASVTHRWSAQDYLPATRLPSVGRIPSIGVPVFTATGFAKWGMTNGTVAARILCDLATGRSHPWPELTGVSPPPRLSVTSHDAPFQRRGGREVRRRPNRRITCARSRCDSTRLGRGRDRQRTEGGGTPRPRWGTAHGRCDVYPPRLHRPLEHCGRELGLSVSWLAFCPRRQRSPRTRGQAPGERPHCRR